MPNPRTKLRNRRGYSDGHFLQLVCSHDYFSDGWGRLDKLTETDLRQTVADMAKCYRLHLEDVLAIRNDQSRDPWFAAYADDPEKLITEILHKEPRNVPAI